MKAGSLFTGTAALDMAAAEILGCELAWVCEYEPPTEKDPRPEQGGAKLLAHHYPNVPNLGDITTVDWSTVESVHVLTGGFPCTDLSLAGAQAGLKPGTRSGLWTQMAYAIARMRPSLVLIENVRGLASAEAHSDLEPCPWCVGDRRDEPALRAFGAVLGDLANLGYDAVWCGLPASAVGAPHSRFRFFIAATRNTAVLGRDDTSAEGRRRQPAGTAGGPGVALADAGGDAIREQPVVERGRGGAAVAGLDQSATPDADGARPQGAEPAGRRDLSSRRTPAHADGRGLAGDTELDLGAQGGVEAPRRLDTAGHLLDWGPYEPAIRRWEAILGRPAPAPTATGARGGRVLNPALPEWMMGLPDGWITAVPGLSRSAQLKLAGNGVVKHQAVAAFRYLLDVLDRDARAAA